MIKVFLGGEGSNDIGTRWHQPIGEEPGVVEALLRKVRATGWEVVGALRWKSIRKYQAGAARRRADHADVHNVLGLVLAAYEHACELLAFVRDSDGDELRESEIARVLRDIASFGFADEFRYELAIVGGVPKPKLEGWILCLRGVRDTDDMTSSAVDRALAAAGVAAKSRERYVAVVDAATLPRDDSSLRRWLAEADSTLRRLIDGTGPP